MVGTGGADEDRTHDLLNAIQALSQLSYSPTRSKQDRKRALRIKIPAAGGAFYPLRARNRYDGVHEKSQGRQAAFGQRCVLALALAAEAQAADVGGGAVGAAAEAASREAGSGRRC